MGNPLFGVNISKLVADALGPGLLDATLSVITPGTRSEDPTAGRQPTSVDFPCKGFIDSKDREEIGGTLVKDGDVVIVLLGDTIDGGDSAPWVNDRVTIEGETYRIQGLDRDPAAATYTLLCPKG